MGLAENLDAIRGRIAAACGRAGRDPSSVTLVGVTKNHPPQTVIEAAQLGVTVFGENRVQEARIKISQCPSRLQWHMIGHLQSNKCRDAVGLFSMIQGVDSLALATELNRKADQAAKTVPILIEVNVAGESTKFGYKPEALLQDLDALNALARLELHGLMMIAPYTPNPERVRPYFRRLRELREQCEQKMGVPLPQLSMGMSGDFEVAVEEGATMVRIGTALFGERPRAVFRRSDED
jgi:pyridoxal phosphate enzyme (YggS family)